MDEKLLRVIKRVKAALEDQGIRVERVILFGSHAKGTADPDSDMDLAVISKDFEDMNLVERLELIGTAMAKAKIWEPIEIKPYTPEEVASQGNGTFVGDEIKPVGVDI